MGRSALRTGRFNQAMGRPGGAKYRAVKMGRSHPNNGLKRPVPKANRPIPSLPNLFFNVGMPVLKNRS